jgi:hypothetical protein
MKAVDERAPLRFLHIGYEPDDWVAVFLKSYESSRTMQRVGPIPFITSSRFQGWLRLLNQAHWNVYVSVNAVASDRRSRARDAIRAIRHVFLEADHDGPHVLATLAERRDLPPPSYLVQSSRNRVHVFWRVSGFVCDQVERLQKKLARELATDPAATSSSQLTRLPGFRNHKYTPAPLITMMYGRMNRVYMPADFPVSDAIHTPTAIPLVHDVPEQTRFERASRYLQALPPAIAGQHGDLHTFCVCCRLVRGFALDDDDALMLLRRWNVRCQPPWSERELVDKIARARRYGREPIGGLLGTSGLPGRF